jgi:hypothetical protein
MWKTINIKERKELNVHFFLIMENLAMGWYFIISSPEPKLGEKQKMKITTKSKINNVELELLLILSCN